MNQEQLESLENQLLLAQAQIGLMARSEELLRDRVDELMTAHARLVGRFERLNAEFISAHNGWWFTLSNLFELKSLKHFKNSKLRHF